MKNYTFELEIQVTENVRCLPINKFVDFYVPIYKVVSKDGSSFDYYVYGGEIDIIG